MAVLNIFRVNALPAQASLVTSSMYITRNATNANLIDLTFVGDTTAEIRHVMGQSDVDEAVRTAIANLSADDIPDLPGSKITSAISVDTTGNAATATLATNATNAENATYAATAGSAEALSPGATINGITFTGANNITVPAVDTETPRVPMSGIGTLVPPLVDGVIPVEYVPLSLVDVEMFPSRSDFPAAGREGVIYIAKDNNAMYRWAPGEGVDGEYILIPTGGGSTESALKLATPRQFNFAGDGTGNITNASGFDGTQNVTLTLTLATVGTAGTGSKVTVNEKGLVTNVAPLAASDIPDLPGSKITSAIGVDTTGNAATATKLKETFALTVDGALNGTVDIDGSGDVTLTLSGGASGVTPGTYSKVTVNAGGLVTAGDVLTAADIPDLPGTKIISALTVDTSGKAATAGVADSAKAIELAASEW